MGSERDVDGLRYREKVHHGRSWKLGSFPKLQFGAENHPHRAILCEDLWRGPCTIHVTASIHVARNTFTIPTNGSPKQELRHIHYILGEVKRFPPLCHGRACLHQMGTGTTGGHVYHLKKHCSHIDSMREQSPDVKTLTTLYLHWFMILDCTWKANDWRSQSLSAVGSTYRPTNFSTGCT